MTYIQGMQTVGVYVHVYEYMYQLNYNTASVEEHKHSSTHIHIHVHVHEGGLHMCISYMHIGMHTKLSHVLRKWATHVHVGPEHTAYMHRAGMCCMHRAGI